MSRMGINWLRPGSSSGLSFATRQEWTTCAREKRTTSDGDLARAKSAILRPECLVAHRILPFTKVTHDIPYIQVDEYIALLTGV